jgi:hypothetical protein
MAYVQPGTENWNGYDPGRTVTSCPFCQSIAYRIGSGRFSMRCQQSGHQFEIANDFGQPELLSSHGLKPSVIKGEIGG